MSCASQPPSPPSPSGETSRPAGAGKRTSVQLPARPRDVAPAGAHDDRSLLDLVAHGDTPLRTRVSVPAHESCDEPLRAADGRGAVACRSSGRSPSRHPTACATSSWPPRAARARFGQRLHQLLDQREVGDPARLRDPEDAVVELRGLRRRARPGDRGQLDDALPRVDGRADRDALRRVEVDEALLPRRRTSPPCPCACATTIVRFATGVGPATVGVGAGVAGRIGGSASAPPRAAVAAWPRTRPGRSPAPCGRATSRWSGPCTRRRRRARRSSTGSAQRRRLPAVVGERGARAHRSCSGAQAAIDSGFDVPAAGGGQDRAAVRRCDDHRGEPDVARVASDRSSPRSGRTPGRGCRIPPPRGRPWPRCGDRHPLERSSRCRPGARPARPAPREALLNAIVESGSRASAGCPSTSSARRRHRPTTGPVP